MIMTESSLLLLHPFVTLSTSHSRRILIQRNRILLSLKDRRRDLSMIVASGRFRLCIDRCNNVLYIMSIQCFALSASTNLPIRRYKEDSSNPPSKDED